MFQLHAYVLTRMDRLLRINLEDVLELTFPCPQDTDQDDISANCIICYNYRLPHGTYITYLYHCLMDYDSFWVEAIWKIICDCLLIQWLYFIYHCIICLWEFWPNVLKQGHIVEPILHGIVCRDWRLGKQRGPCARQGVWQWQLWTSIPQCLSGGVAQSHTDYKTVNCLFLHSCDIFYPCLFPVHISFCYNVFAVLLFLGFMSPLSNSYGKHFVLSCRSFDVLFGSCPCCSHPIMVKCTSG